MQQSIKWSSFAQINQNSSKLANFDTKDPTNANVKASDIRRQKNVTIQKNRIC